MNKIFRFELFFVFLIFCVVLNNNKVLADNTIYGNEEVYYSDNILKTQDNNILKETEEEILEMPDSTTPDIIDNDVIRYDDAYDDTKEDYNEINYNEVHNNEINDNGIISEKIMLFVGKTYKDVVYSCDLFSIDNNPLYKYVVFEEGYCIYYKDNDYLIEFSDNSNVPPYLGYETNIKIYVGPLSYFYYDENKYFDCLEDEEIYINDYKEKEKSLLLKLNNSDKGDYNGFISENNRLLVQSNYNSIPNNLVRYDERLINNADIIRNMPFGDNINNTCGVIASSMLLTFYDRIGYDLLDSDIDPYESNNSNDVLHSYLLANYRFEGAEGGGSYPWQDARLINNYLGNECPNSNLHAEYSLTGVRIIEQLENNNPIIAYGEYDVDPFTIDYDIGPNGNKHALIVYGYCYGANDIYYKCHYGWHSKDYDDVWISSEMYMIGGIVYIEKTDAHTHESGLLYNDTLTDLDDRNLYHCAYPNCNALMSDDCADDYRYAKVLESESNPIDPGFLFSGRIDRKEDKDIYRFSLDTPKYFTTDVTFDKLGTVRLFDEACNELCISSAQKGHTLSDIKLDQGVYFLEINSELLQGYEVSMQFNGYDVEGDSIDNPTVLAFAGNNSVFSGKIEVLNDEDWFTFDVPYKAHVTLITQSDSPNLYIQLFNEKKNLLISIDTKNATHEARINNKLLEPGRYNVKIRGDLTQKYMIYMTINNSKDLEADKIDDADALHFVYKDSLPVISKDTVINYSGDNDYYCFYLPYKSHVTFETRAETNRLNMQLFSSNKTLLNSLMSNGIDNTATINHKLLSEGLYYIKIASDTEQKYALIINVDTLSDIEPDTIDMSEELHNVSLNGMLGYYKKGMINYIGDIDFYCLEIPYKSHVTLSTQADNVRLYMQLYRSDKALLNSINSNSADCKAVINHKLLEPGVYFIRISSDTEQDYDININLDTLVDEGADTIGEAEKIENDLSFDLPHFSKQGVINYVGDLDYYYFEITYRSHVTLNVKAENPRLYMQLYREDRALLNSINSSNANYEAVINHKLLEPGLYYVRVSSDSEQLYSLNISVDTRSDNESDTVEASETLADVNDNERPHFIRQGEINYSGDIDYYCIEIPYKGHITFNTQAQNATILMQLYSENGSLLNSINSGAANNVALINHKLLKPGKYYIRLSSNYEQDYMLEVSVDTSRDKEPDILNESEVLHPSNNTGRIHYDKKGIINYSGDVDCFCFDVPYKGHVTLNAKAQKPDLVMYVYNEKYSHLQSVNSNSSDNKAVVKYRLFEPGKYYIRLSSNSEQDYTLDISYDTEEDIEPDILNEAKELSLYSQSDPIEYLYYGNIHYSRDVDCFSFEVPYKSHVTITTEAQMPSLVMYIYKQNNVHMYSTNSNVSDYKAVYRYGLLDEGRYYIRVSSNDVQDYRIQATIDTTEDKEANDINGAISIDRGIKNGEINYSTDVDYYCFDIPEKKEINLFVSAETGNMIIRVYNENNSYIFSGSTNGENNRFEINNLTLNAGRYYVSVSSNYVQPYSLCVQQ